MYDPITYNQEELSERATIFLNVLSAINATEFEYNYELWGVFWIPWSVEVDAKEIRFPINDISLADFVYMEEKGLIAFVEDLENCNDKFGRKVFRIINIPKLEY